ncbi:MAG: DUF5685 family protein, partial [bacterium]
HRGALCAHGGGAGFGGRRADLAGDGGLMFGYVRPLVPELKVKELERFRAMYCGLCHELRRQYGIPARFILNYDFVFLAMLLSGEGERQQYALRRCPVSPLRRRCVCASCGALRKAAAESVILAYQKLSDSQRDGRFWERTGAFWAKLLLRRAYRKAAKDEPEFDSAVTHSLQSLHALEEANGASLDAAADTFATLLAASAAERVRRELLYHLGRLIYIADAWDDLGEDLRQKGYNPIALRYGVAALPAPEETRAAVRRTMELSAERILAAFALLPETIWTPILYNIICAGLPDMMERVLAGTYHEKARGYPKGERV